MEGRWPEDIAGWLFDIGPERSAPGGHWLLGQGLLCRVACEPDAQGRIGVDLRRVDTPLENLRRAQPGLFRHSGVQEVSPYGFSSFANTNVIELGGRLFLGYDVGRPVEVDPEALEYITPVGANAEWLQTLRAPVEPMVAVAAHPGPDWDENVFVAPRDFPREPIPGALARFDLDRMQVAEVHAYDGGAFPHPPMFVPRSGCRHDADGYVFVFVHRDGDKAIEVFDAGNLSAGPRASASAKGFNVPLLWHSWWAPGHTGPRPSQYRVDPEGDAWDTLQAFAEDPSARVGIARAIFDRSV